MYCKNCGSEIREGSRFCTKCGALVTPTGPASGNAPQATEAAAAPEPTAVSQPKEKRKVPGFLIPLLIVVAVAVVVLIVFGSRASRRIDLSKYTTIEFSGFEGYGTASASFDWNAVSEKYDNRIRIGDTDWGWWYDSFSEALDDCIYMHVSPKSGLYNGDEVTVSWEVDAEDLDYIVGKHINVIAEPQTFTVSGLGTAGTFDAFAGVSVEFSGTSPNVSASVRTVGDAADELFYSLSQSSGLAIGDVVTVSIDESSATSYMLDHGAYPMEMEKDFLVEDVPYYVSSLSEIPADGLQKLKEQAEDVFMASTASWSEYAHLDSVEYLGCYLLSEKPGVSKNTVNYIYMVYEPHVTQSGINEDGSESTTNVDYYWYAGFFNGIVLNDGTFSIDYSDYTTPSYSWGSGDGFDVTTYDASREDTSPKEIRLTYTGFEQLDTLFNNVVTQKIDEYTYESSVTEGAAET